MANNLFGKITLENQNPAAPEILYNGLRTLVIDVFIKEIIGGINTVDQGNVYIGFKDEDIDRAESIFAQLSSSVDQVPVNTNPTVITYNTQDEINGIGHSTSLNPGELEILPGFGGVYFVSPQPQVGKDTGGVKTDFDMFWEIDRGSGFADEPQLERQDHHQGQRYHHHRLLRVHDRAERRGQDTDAAAGKQLYRGAWIEEHRPGGRTTDGPEDALHNSYHAPSRRSASVTSRRIS